jgi:hypothetical protein
MRRAQIALVAGLILAGVIALLAGWALLVRGAAESLRTEIALTSTNLRSGQISAARQHLSGAEAAASRVTSLTPGPVGGIAELLPVLGTQVTDARAVASAVTDLAPAVTPLLDLGARAQASGLRTDDGRIDLSLLDEAAPLLGDAAAAAREASARLGDAQAPEVVDATRDLDRVARLLDRAAEASAYLPAMLGAEGPRTYAVLLQNIAEIRGSGGLLGAYALVTLDSGRVTLAEAAARKDGLDDDTIPYDEVADQDQIATWGADLGEWATYNLSLDFPLTGELTAAGMAARGTPVDGVIGLDARIVAALLAGTGPIEEGGARLTRDNAEAFFTRDIYAKLPEVDAKDDLTVRLLQATLQRALGGSIDVPALLAAAVDPVSESRLRVWSTDQEIQEWLITTPLGGALPERPGPYVGIDLNNAAGSKLDAYVSLAARYRVGMCPGEPEQESTVEIRLRNDAPEGLPDYVDLRLDRPDAPKGSTSLLVHVYGPQGAGLRWARIDGRGEGFTATHERGHPVWGFDVELERGQEVLLRLALTEPTVEGVSPLLDLPPLAEPVRGKVTDRQCPPPE